MCYIFLFYFFPFLSLVRSIIVRCGVWFAIQISMNSSLVIRPQMMSSASTKEIWYFMHYWMLHIHKTPTKRRLFILFFFHIKWKIYNKKSGTFFFLLLLFSSLHFLFTSVGLKRFVFHFFAVLFLSVTCVNWNGYKSTHSKYRTQVSSKHWRANKHLNQIWTCILAPFSWFRRSNVCLIYFQFHFGVLEHFLTHTHISFVLSLPERKKCASKWRASSRSAAHTRL